MSLRPARSAETPRVLTAYEVAPLRNAAHVTVRRRSLALPGAIRIGRQWRYVRRILTDWLARPEAGTPDRGAVAAELVGGRPEMVMLQEMAGVLRVADLIVRRLVQAGELPGAFKFGGKWRCLRTYFASRLAGASALLAFEEVAATLVARLADPLTLVEMSRHLRADPGLVTRLAQTHELPCAFRLEGAWRCPRNLYAAWLARQMGQAARRWN
jgi:hypothetical protein